MKNSNCFYCGASQRDKECADIRCITERNIDHLKRNGDKYGLISLLESVREKLASDFMPRKRKASLERCFPKLTKF